MSYICINIPLIYLISFMLGDQLVIYYGFSHRSVKWWKRCFFHLLDLSLVNSHILYKAVTSSRITQLDFRLSVAKSLLEGLERPRQRHHEPSPQLPVRLTERAFPEPIPGEQTAKSVVYVWLGNDIKQHIGASYATHHCACTHASSGTIP